MWLLSIALAFLLLFLVIKIVCFFIRVTVRFIFSWPFLMIAIVCFLIYLLC